LIRSRRCLTLTCLAAALALTAPAVVLGADPGEPPPAGDPATPPATPPASQAPAAPEESSLTITVPPEVRPSAPAPRASGKQSPSPAPAAETTTPAETAPAPAPASRSRSSSEGGSGARASSTDAAQAEAAATRARAAKLKQQKAAAAAKRAAELRKAEAARRATAEREKIAARQQPAGAPFVPPVANPASVTVASADTSIPIAAMTTLFAGLLLFAAASLLPGQALAQLGPRATPAIRLATGVVGLSLVLGTLVALLSSA
jgi:type IV secretory pathway VirB10-like protein